jgi:hypothetical protein
MDAMDKVKRKGADLESPADVPKVKPQKEDYKPPISRAVRDGLEAVQRHNEPPPQEEEEQRQEEDNLPLGEGLSLEELRNILNASETRFANQKRKEEIEKRCKPLDFDDLLTYNEIRQAVPIIPGKLEAEFRTISGKEDLELKKMMMAGEDTYLKEKLTICYLALSLTRINEKELPDFRTKGEFDQKSFNNRLEEILKLPEILLVDLNVNMRWFRQRIEDLMVDQEELKNG